MLRDDDRTPEQMQTHTWLVIGTDSFMSGWGKASFGNSYAAWACTPEDRRACLGWVESRSDMKRVREAPAHDYRPSGNGHLHIYVYNGQH